MGICSSHWPQIMKADAQIPEGPVLVGTPVFSDLHSLSIASVIFIFCFLSLPVYLSLYLIALHFLPTFDNYSLRPFMYSFLPHMPHEGPSCLGNIVRPSSGLSHPLLSCSLSSRYSFVMCSDDRFINGNGLPSITPLLWREILECIRLVITLKG